MKKNRKANPLKYGIPILVIIALSGIVPVIAGPSPPLKPYPIPYGDYSYVIEFAEYSIAKMMKKYDLPSVAISIVDDQNTILSSVKGVTKEQFGSEATPETVYRIGSISKVFTAIEIMRLYEEGLLDLDDPITRFLPGFDVKNRFNDSTPITIRHILAHRSGLPRNGNLVSWHWDSGAENVLRDLVDSVDDTYTAYPAGYRYKYSNFAFNLLGRIIEVIRGQPFFIVMQNEVFRPLGMNNTACISYMLNPQLNNAVGYYYNEESKENIAYAQYDFIKLCSGNIYSTTEDMTLFMKWLFSDEPELVLKKQTLREMFVDQYSKPEDPQTNGLGFFTYTSPGGELVVFHDGNIEGTLSSMFTLPDRKLGVFMTSNSERFGEAYQFFVMDLIDILLETKYRIKPVDKVKEHISVDTAKLSEYAGKYIFYDEIGSVKVKNNKLKGKIYGFNVGFTPISESTFQAYHWLLDVSFVTMTFFDEYAILSIAGIDTKFCPKYPEYSTIPENWSVFLGEYDTYQRKESIYTDHWGIIRNEMKIEDGVLTFARGYFHLISISETELVIMSGPHDGEIMERDPVTGYISWSHLEYRPV